jgi:hypothetical protein
VTSGATGHADVSETPLQRRALYFEDGLIGCPDWKRFVLEPEAVGPADADVARAAGVSTEALRDALYVCAYFNLIDRLADAFGCRPVSEAIGAVRMWEHSKGFLERGYA